MADTCIDVIVVGGGVVGSATAMTCAKHGHKTVLLEKFDLLHKRGSSHGASRLVRCVYGEEHYANLARPVVRLWRDLEKESGKSLFLGDIGGLEIGGQESLKEIMHAMKATKIDHEVLSSTEVHRRHPGIELPSHYVGVYEPTAGIVKASKAVRTFQDMATRYGCDVRDNVEVVHIQSTSDGRVEVIIRETKFDGRTTTQTLVAKKCIIAAGGWTGELVQRSFGIRLDFQAKQVAYYYYKPRDGSDSLFNADKLPILIDRETFMYCIPSDIDYPGLLKVGSHWDRVDLESVEGRTFKPPKEHENLVTDWVAKYLPQVDSSGPLMSETCLYTMSKGDEFLLDTLASKGHPNIVIGGGFSGHGFKFAPLTGLMLAGLAGVDVSEAMSGIDIDQVDPAPFKLENHLLGAEAKL